MNILKAYINGNWQKVGIAKFNSGSIYEQMLPNLANYAGSGEIAMWVANLKRPLGFAIQLTSSGTATIDWGDNSSETITASAYTTQFSANSLTAQVNHTYGDGNPSGQGIWIEELSTFVYLVRIYNASSAIKYFKCARVTTQYNDQNNGVIDAYLNLTTLVDISQMFSNGVAVSKLRCKLLHKVRLVNADNVVYSDYFAYECIEFENFNFPAMPLATSRTYALFQTQLRYDNINNLYVGAGTSSMLQRFTNGGLMRVYANASDWGSISNTSYCYSSNFMLNTVQLPLGIGNDKNTNCDYMFANCYNIISFSGLEYLGSRTLNCSMNGTFDGLESYTGALVINAKLTKFTCKGTSSYLNGVTSIRLLNANSPFSGTSSQVDVSYCNLSASALNQLFTDLPTLSGKTIKITGCTGAGTCDQTIATNKGWIVSN